MVGRKMRKGFMGCLNYMASEHESVEVTLYENGLANPITGVLERRDNNGNNMGLYVNNRQIPSRGLMKVDVRENKIEVNLDYLTR